MPLFVAEYLSIAVGIFVIGAGILEIKDYFWYGQGPSLRIPSYFAQKITRMSSRITLPSVILLGAFVAGVELPCTGAPYLAIISILSLNFNLWAMILLVIYNLVFVVPLVIILLMVVGGHQLNSIKQWKEDSRGVMRLAIGLLLVGLGWLLILIANGTINLG